MVMAQRQPTKPVPTRCSRGVITSLITSSKRRSQAIMWCVVACMPVCCGCSSLLTGITPVKSGQIQVSDEVGGQWTLGYQAPTDAWDWLGRVLAIALAGAAISAVLVAGVWLVHSRAKRIWPDVPASAAAINGAVKGGS